MIFSKIDFSLKSETKKDISNIFQPFLQVYKFENKDISEWSILVNLISFYINFHTFAYFLAMNLYYFFKISEKDEPVHISN